jgi:hypothetical protein
VQQNKIFVIIYGLNYAGQQKHYSTPIICIYNKDLKDTEMRKHKLDRRLLKLSSDEELSVGYNNHFSTLSLLLRVCLD